MRKTGVIACFALLFAITGIRGGPLQKASNGTVVASASQGAITCRNDSVTPGFDGNAVAPKNATANTTQTPILDSVVSAIQNSTGNHTPAVEWGRGGNATLASNQSAPADAGSASCRNNTLCLNATATSGRNATSGTRRVAALRNDTTGEELLNDEDVARINDTERGCPPLVGLEAWGGRAPLAVERLRPPAPFVVIHHTYIPAACNDSRDCEAKMRQMQDFHMGKGWLNIGYNFIVGGDNRVYVGRGWDVVGAHSPAYNSKSVGISFIGDYRTQLPTQEMLELAWSLIRCGVARGSISEAYTLVGHRQVRDTECPGDRLYQEIQTWPHWAAHRDIIPRANATATTTTTTPRA